MATVDAGNASYGEQAIAIGYQVYRDFNQCLRTIPNSTRWNPAAYQIEYQTCCSEMWFGNLLATEVNWEREPMPLQTIYDAACPTEGEEEATAETRRTARIDAMLARPERFD